MRTCLCSARIWRELADGASVGRGAPVPLSVLVVPGRVGEPDEKPRPEVLAGKCMVVVSFTPCPWPIAADRRKRVSSAFSVCLSSPLSSIASGKSDVGAAYQMNAENPTLWVKSFNLCAPGMSGSSLPPFCWIEE